MKNWKTWAILILVLLGLFIAGSAFSKWFYWQLYEDAKTFDPR